MDKGRVATVTVTRGLIPHRDTREDYFYRTPSFIQVGGMPVVRRVAPVTTGDVNGTVTLVR